MLDRSAPKRITPSAGIRALVTHGRPVAVFTSIEGSLVDPRTFNSEPNRRMLSRLARAGVPLVPVTVMTLGEIEPIVNDLPIVEVMIIEAGGAIARRVAGEWSVEPCGAPADALLGVIAQIEERSGASLLVYSVLPDADAAAISGRTGEMLRGSTRRFFSEPFVIERGDVGKVTRAAASIGYSVRRGPRFLHLCRICDEGTAFERVKQDLACDVTIAVGTSPIDAEFLRRAEIPVIVPGPEGVDQELLRLVPNGRVALAPAPAGWTTGIRLALHELSRNRQRGIGKVNDACVE
jgi:mannosyl-3-phosphoglycerate phosphatase